jgi:hypothetical protein
MEYNSIGLNGSIDLNEFNQNQQDASVINNNNINDHMDHTNNNNNNSNISSNISTSTSPSKSWTARASTASTSLRHKHDHIPRDVPKLPADSVLAQRIRQTHLDKSVHLYQRGHGFGQNAGTTLQLRLLDGKSVFLYLCACMQIHVVY